MTLDKEMKIFPKVFHQIQRSMWMQFPSPPPGANFLSSLPGAHKHWCTFGRVGFASHLVFFSIIKAPLMSNLLYHLA